MRLDHLLSKEHYTFHHRVCGGVAHGWNHQSECLTHCVWAGVVRALLSGGVVELLVRVGVWGVGTLLGFEGTTVCHGCEVVVGCCFLGAARRRVLFAGCLVVVLVCCLRIV